MKAFKHPGENGSPGRPHPSLCGEVFRNVRNGRVQADRYPDFGIEPHSAFPICIGGIGNCSRYSGATVPDSHRVPRHLTALVAETFPPVSKSAPFLRRAKFFPSKKGGGLSGSGLRFRFRARAGKMVVQPWTNLSSRPERPSAITGPTCGATGSCFSSCRGATSWCATSRPSSACSGRCCGRC